MGAEIRVGSKLTKIALTKKIEESEKQLIIGVGKNTKPIVEGLFVSHRCDDAFFIHGSRSLELLDTHIVSTAPTSLIVTLLLSGKLSFGYDDARFNLDGSTQPQGALVNLTKPASFHRTINRGCRVAKLNLSIKPEWIISRSSETCHIRQFLAGHKNALQFCLSEELANLVEQVLNLHNATRFEQQIQIESLSYQIIALIIEQLDRSLMRTNSSPRVNLNSPTVEDVIHYINTHLEQPLMIDDIANHFSMSASTLQRKFRQQLGVTIIGYIRMRRLEIAKQYLSRGLVTITEAAYEAGYNHPSNFTIAFKKAFGYPPAEIPPDELSC